MFSLAGKVVVVTGGTGVLGDAFVDAIAAAGASVAIIARNEALGQEKVAQLAQRGSNALFVAADVLAQPQLEAARDRILQTYGRIDGLVNAAGGNLPEGVLSPADDVFSLNIEGMKRALDLNLWGAVIPTQVFGPALAAAGNGTVVNISSVSAKRALSRVLGYSMGKAALDCYTKWMAVEMAARYGDSLRINSLTPGFFLTRQNHHLLRQEDGSWTDRAQAILRQTPFRRFGQPSELLGALLWLLSDASAFVTGADIAVDGGFSIHSGV
jgi:NAD(P)-dependent dehydrogenase (short-subunit alcohol dehydrogenase family)